MAKTLLEVAEVAVPIVIAFLKKKLNEKEKETN